ncbi:hypothetical protein Droror1_Dr00008272 [Drosera rotundifolia]
MELSCILEKLSKLGKDSSFKSSSKLVLYSSRPELVNEFEGRNSTSSSSSSSEVFVDAEVEIAASEKGEDDDRHAELEVLGDGDEGDCNAASVVERGEAEKCAPAAVMEENSEIAVEDGVECSSRCEDGDTGSRMPASSSLLGLSNRSSSENTIHGEPSISNHLATSSWSRRDNPLSVSVARLFDEKVPIRKKDSGDITIKDPMKHIVKIIALLVAISSVWIGLLQASIIPRSNTCAEATLVTKCSGAVERFRGGFLKVRSFGDEVLDIEGAVEGFRGAFFKTKTNFDYKTATKTKRAWCVFEFGFYPNESSPAISKSNPKQSVATTTLHQTKQPNQPPTHTPKTTTSRHPCTIQARRLASAVPSRPLRRVSVPSAAVPFFFIELGTKPRILTQNPNPNRPTSSLRRRNTPLHHHRQPQRYSPRRIRSKFRLLLRAELEDAVSVKELVDEIEREKVELVRGRRWRRWRRLNEAVNRAVVTEANRGRGVFGCG